MTTNDPEKPNVKLTCAGKVLVPFQTAPRTVNFGKLRRDAPAQTKTVTITRGDGGPLKLDVLPTSNKRVKTELREVEPGEKYALEVTIEPPWPNDRFRGRINIATGVPETPRSSIALYANITPRLVAQPSRFTLPSTFNNDMQRSAKLIWDDDQPHKILGATVNDPDLSVAVEEKDGQQHLVLNIPAGYRRKAGARYVTVRTDDPVASNLKVPVTFARRGRPDVSRSRAGTAVRPSRVKRPATPTPPVTAARAPAQAQKPRGTEPPAGEKDPPKEP